MSYADRTREYNDSIVDFVKKLPILFEDRVVALLNFIENLPKGLNKEDLLTRDVQYTSANQPEIKICVLAKKVNKRYSVLNFSYKGNKMLNFSGIDNIAREVIIDLGGRLTNINRVLSDLCNDQVIYYDTELNNDIANDWGSWADAVDASPEAIGFDQVTPWKNENEVIGEILQRIRTSDNMVANLLLEIMDQIAQAHRHNLDKNGLRINSFGYKIFARVNFPNEGLTELGLAIDSIEVIPIPEDSRCNTFMFDPTLVVADITRFKPFLSQGLQSRIALLGGGSNYGIEDFRESLCMHDYTIGTNCRVVYSLPEIGTNWLRLGRVFGEELIAVLIVYIYERIEHGMIKELMKSFYYFLENFLKKGRVSFQSTNTSQRVIRFWMIDKNTSTDVPCMFMLPTFILFNPCQKYQPEVFKETHQIAHQLL